MSGRVLSLSVGLSSPTLSSQTTTSNLMSDKQVDGALPLHDPSDALDASTTNAGEVAKSWIDEFGAKCGKGDVDGIVDMFWEEGFWRDMLPLTWSYRSLGGKNGGKKRIKEVLDQRLVKSQFSNFQVDPNFPPEVQNLFPDCSFVMVCFTFQCKAGGGSGIVRLVPSKTKKGAWEAFTLFTLLESLHGVEEKLGPNRENAAYSNSKSWSEIREEQVEFANREPEVLIIGAGQSGLNVAARLKALGVDTLCIDRNEEVGDNWAKRYKALRLHDPVWYDHLAYIPFPASWPVFTPSVKLAGWLKSYAIQMELNIWMGTNIEASAWDEKAGHWTFQVTRKVDGKPTKRTIKPRIIVWACGLGGGEPRMPVIDGMDTFCGKIVHSSEHGSGKDWQGKKVVVVGACTSSHDISKDFADHGVDITMIQRSSTYIMSVEKGMPAMMSPLYVEGGPPTDFADRINASIPNAVMKELHKRVAAHIASEDKELLDNLHKVGFQTNMGEDDSGFLMMAWAKAGGYYLDVGASQYIIDKKIKLKSGSGIKKFTKDEIVFEDGSTMKADYVVFATGYGDARNPIKKVLGEAAKDCKQFWGLDFERELQGVWSAGSGVPNAILFAGNLALCRFNSKPVALQIKAQLNGTFKEGDRFDLASSTKQSNGIKA